MKYTWLQQDGNDKTSQNFQAQGLFTNYDYKTRQVGGPKISIFCQRSYHGKSQHRGIGGQKSQNLVNAVCERPLVIYLMPFKENQHCWCALKCTLSVSNHTGQIVNTIFYAHSLRMGVVQWCYLENPLQGSSWQTVFFKLSSDRQKYTN